MACYSTNHGNACSLYVKEGSASADVNETQQASITEEPTSSRIPTPALLSFEAFLQSDAGRALQQDIAQPMDWYSPTGDDFSRRVINGALSDPKDLFDLATFHHWATTAKFDLEVEAKSTFPLYNMTTGHSFEVPVTTVLRIGVKLPGSGKVSPTATSSQHANTFQTCIKSKRRG